MSDVLLSINPIVWEAMLAEVERLRAAGRSAIWLAGPECKKGPIGHEQVSSDICRAIGQRDHTYISEPKLGYRW
jgi:hypothetical protein